MRILPALAALLVLSLATGACAARGGVPRPFPGAAIPPGAAPAPAAPADSEPRREEPVEAFAAGPVVTTALRMVGAPYRNGGADPSGFDCSGFVQYVFAEHGLPLPRQVREQYDTGEDIRLTEVQPGDLLFFQTVARGASHVGVAIGGDRFVHAPSSKGVVRIERYSAPYWASRFVGARRVTRAPAQAAMNRPR